MKRRYLIVVSLMWISELSAEALKCTVNIIDNEVSVHVEMVKPHPNQMVLRPPEGKTLWLVSSFLKYPLFEKNRFKEIDSFELNKNIKATSWDDEGNEILLPIFQQPGRYELYIADNVETERDNTWWQSCSFVLP